MYKSIVITLAVVGLAVSANGLIQEQVLKKGLLEAYDKSVKPDGVTKVKVGHHVLDLDICPHKEMFKMTGWTSYAWNDTRLAWDASKNGGIKMLRVDSSDIWIPDITLYNQAKPTESNYVTWDDSVNVVVVSSGLIIYVPPQTYRSFCKVNYADYPWGVQNCTMTFGSWTYSVEELDVVAEGLFSDVIDTDTMKTDHVEIVGKYTERHEKVYSCCPEAYPSLDFTIAFKRKSMFKDDKLMTP